MLQPLETTVVQTKNPTLMQVGPVLCGFSTVKNTYNKVLNVCVETGLRPLQHGQDWNESDKNTGLTWVCCVRIKPLLLARVEGVTWNST